MAANAECQHIFIYTITHNNKQFRFQLHQHKYKQIIKQKTVENERKKKQQQ